MPQTLPSDSLTEHLVLTVPSFLASRHLAEEWVEHAVSRQTESVVLDFSENRLIALACCDGIALHLITSGAKKIQLVNHDSLTPRHFVKSIARHGASVELLYTR